MIFVISAQNTLSAYLFFSKSFMFLPLKKMLSLFSYVFIIHGLPVSLFSSRFLGLYITWVETSFFISNYMSVFFPFFLSPSPSLSHNLQNRLCGKDPDLTDETSWVYNSIDVLSLQNQISQTCFCFQIYIF